MPCASEHSLTLPWSRSYKSVQTIDQGIVDFAQACIRRPCRSSDAVSPGYLEVYDQVEVVTIMWRLRSIHDRQDLLSLARHDHRSA